MPAVLLPPIASVVTAGVMILGALTGVWPLAAAVILVQAALAYAIPAGEPRSDRIRTGLLAFVAGAVAAVVVASDEGAVGRENSLGLIAYVVGPAVIVALLLQLARRRDRDPVAADPVVERLASAVTAVALAGMLAAALPLYDLGGVVGGDLVTLTVGCSLLAALPGRATGPAARLGAAWWVVKVLALAGAGALVVSDPAGLGPATSAAVGGVAAFCGLLGAEIAARAGANTAARSLLTPAVTLALAAPLAYLVARVMLT